MARKSKFAVGYVNINKMTLPQLQAYVKKATPYMERKVKGLAASKFADFSDTLQYLQGESMRAGLYGASDTIGNALVDEINLKHDPELALKALLEGEKTPDQLRRAARLINVIASEQEQPAQMAKAYIATAQDIKTILGSWGYDDAAKMIGELASTPKGLNNLRAWWKAYQDEIFEYLGSGDDDDNLDIVYYKDKYGEDTEQFYIELFKRINELQDKLNF